MPGQSITAAYHSLIAAVIERAVADLKGAGLRCGKADTDQAMAFILSETCEAYCIELERDYLTLREKAVDLYQKIITVESLPRKKYHRKAPGRLQVNRHFRISIKRCLKTIHRNRDR